MPRTNRPHPEPRLGPLKPGTGHGSVRARLVLLFFLASAARADEPGTTGARQANLSTRASVGFGAKAEIIGFVIPGDSADGAHGGSKVILIRALGPALARTGITEPLAHPILTLFDSRGRMVASDSGWENPPIMSPEFFWDAPDPIWGQSMPKGPAVRAARAADMPAGAIGLPAGSADSAMVAVLPPGAYTVKVTGLPGEGIAGESDVGIALAEIFEMDGKDDAHFFNLSTRAFVGTGQAAIVAGLNSSGKSDGTFLVRAVGPTLGFFDVPGALRNPVLTIFDSKGGVIATNQGWGNDPIRGASPSPAKVRAATAADMLAVGAFKLHVNSSDSAMVLTLPPGAYTAAISGVDGTTGIALIESYQLGR
jgi:hypothetical protein